MPRFRKKPVEIEAIQFNKDLDWLDIVRKFPVNNDSIHPISYKPEGVLEIRTLEGVMTAQPGDWIIKGIHGEFYPCKPDIFEETYELIGDENAIP